jgi:alkanesulfonate monooxygenase SsuD/methylene tetrahydromethanopterin reductase-like flavin-dependent oxidoreductase (luciferase family)
VVRPTFAFTGKHYRVDEVTFTPTPLQRPRIPIWVGGGYPKRGPTRRALRWDGANLYPAGRGDADLEARQVQRLRTEADNPEFDIVVGGHERKENWDAERARRAEVAAAGATWWVEWIRPADRETMRRKVSAGPLLIE